jgi:pimeloyl-ACP methyl ester carboxylesterase
MAEHEHREWVVLESEEHQLFGVVHRPKEQTLPGPALLTCHGFGGTKVGRFRLYVNLAQRLSELGVTVLRLDFRGSGDSEGELTEITVQGQIKDALCGLQHLCALEGVDPTRVGLLGASLGGAVAVNAAEQFQKCKSLGLWAPLYCPQKWLQHWASKQPGFSFSQPTVEGWPVSEAFIQGFMALQVEAALGALAHVPFFHAHGEQDELVLIDHADEYERVRHGAEVENRFVRLPQADHVFSRPDDRKELIEQTAQWFAHTL